MSLNLLTAIGLVDLHQVGLNLDDSPLPERSAAISPIRNDDEFDASPYTGPPPPPPASAPLSPASAAAAATALDAVTAARFPPRSPTSDNIKKNSLGSDAHDWGSSVPISDDMTGRAASLHRPPAPQRKALPPPSAQPPPAQAPASATRRFPDKSSIGMLESELNDEFLTVCTCTFIQLMHICFSFGLRPYGLMCYPNASP